MRSPLEDAELVLDMWANESSAIMGSVAFTGIVLTFSGVIKRLDDHVFVIKPPTGAGLWVYVTIDLTHAVGFDYHDKRGVPAALAARADEIISGLFIDFPASTFLVPYEVKV